MVLGSGLSGLSGWLADQFLLINLKPVGQWRCHRYPLLEMIAHSVGVVIFVIVTVVVVVILVL